MGRWAGGARGDLMHRKHAPSTGAPNQQPRQRAAAQIPHPPLATADLCHRRTRGEPPGKPAPQPGSKPQEGPRETPPELTSTATKPAPPHPPATRIHRGNQPCSYRGGQDLRRRRVRRRDHAGERFGDEEGSTSG